jgi:hypothetical protein
MYTYMNILRCAIQTMGDLSVRFGFYGGGWDGDLAGAQDEAGEVCIRMYVCMYEHLFIFIYIFIYVRTVRTCCVSGFFRIRMIAVISSLSCKPFIVLFIVSIYIYIGFDY